MKLKTQQVEFYREAGYLLIEDYLSAEEVDILSSELCKTIDRGSPRVILESNGSVRSVFAPHFVNTCYERLSRLDKLVTPTEQLIGSPIYLHQYKINTKKALKGEWWEWHQDFPYWCIDDGIAEPDMLTVMIYLQETTHLNGALLLIPGSHKMGIAKFEDKLAFGGDNNGSAGHHRGVGEHLSSLNANIKFTVDHEILKTMCLNNGIVAACGTKGTVLFFHGNLFHASNANLTPFDRDCVLITYNSVNNTPRRVENPRPEFLAGRNYAGISKIREIVPE
jgi:ectoine hydroxylase